MHLAINVILVQAGGARLQLDRDPGAARTALETIEGVARDTLVEIDRLVTACATTPAQTATTRTTPSPGCPHSTGSSSAPGQRDST